MQSDEVQGQNSLGMEQGNRFNHFSPFMYTKSKRIRNKNWELLEIQVLKKMIDNQYELLNSRHTNAMINARKNLVWRRIADSINALGLHRRSVREIKIKWSNMRLTEKRKCGNQPSSTGTTQDDVMDMTSIDTESENHDEDEIHSGGQNNVNIQSKTKGNFPHRDDFQRMTTTSPSSSAEKISSTSTETELITCEGSRQPLPRSDSANTGNRGSDVQHYTDRLLPPHADNSVQYRPRSHEQDFERAEQNSSRQSTSLYEDRIYLPGVIIKPEPLDHYSSRERSSDVTSHGNYGGIGQRWSNNGNNRHKNTAIQTEWSLSSRREYDCPPATVTEHEFMAKKYEILKLEEEQLRLKNENMVLQNAKLRIELSKMQKY